MYIVRTNFTFKLPVCKWTFPVNNYPFLNKPEITFPTKRNVFIGKVN